MTKKRCYIFDIDGTIANGNGRDFYNATDEEVAADLPIKPVITILNSLYETGYDILFVSGREDKYKKTTIEWIEDNTRVKFPIVYMRKTKDFRKDSVIKKEILEKDILPYYDIIASVDDRLKVCQMWYDMKIFCICVNQGLINY